MSCPQFSGRRVCFCKEKLIQRDSKVWAHTPRRKSFKRAEGKRRQSRASMHVKHICVDIKRSPAIGFTGESNLRSSNIYSCTRRILMVIKQKVTVYPRSPAGDLPQHTRKCHQCRHFAACQSPFELPSRHQFIRALHDVIGFLYALMFAAVCLLPPKAVINISLQAD